MSKSCQACNHCEDTVIFELCTHPTSEYNVAGKLDFHTVAHMRRLQCGAEGRLFKPADTVLGCR